MRQRISRRASLKIATAGATAAFLGRFAKSVSAIDAPASKPTARPRTFFGVNVDPVYECATPEDLKQLSHALTTLRAGSVRMPIRWIVAERLKGRWNWSHIDRAIEAIPADVEILGTLMSIPAWSTGIDPAQAQGWPDTYPPKQISDWEAFIGRAVERYKSRITHWEIWNEENGIDFFHPQPDAKTYVGLLRTAYAAAKRADPKCWVALGGLQMNGIIANPWSPVKVPDFLKHVYEAGGGTCFDICNTHPYVGPGDTARHMIELTRKTRQVMADFGDAKKPLWLTEFGCGLNKQTTADAQAKLLSDAYRLASAETGIDRLFWFTLRNLARDLLGPESSMGLMTHDWQPKPAYLAFQKIASAAGR